MFFNNGSGYSEPQTKARLLGGKVRLEDFTQSLLADANSGIAHRYFNTAVPPGDARVKLPATRHRLKCIDRNVREAGFQSLAVASDFYGLKISFKCYLNTLLIRLWLNERYCFIDQLTNVDGLHRKAGGAAVIEQVID